MKWLDRTLITSPYCYGLCYSEKEFHKELRRLEIARSEWPQFIGFGKNSSADATTHFLTLKNKNHAAIVCVGNSRGKSREQIYALLTHEAVHIWQYIKENLGEDDPSHEFEAYAIQAITQNLTTAYFGRKKS